MTSFTHQDPTHWLVPRWWLAVRSRWWVASRTRRGMGRMPAIAVRGLRLAVGGPRIRRGVGRLLLRVARLRVVRRRSWRVRTPWRGSVVGPWARPWRRSVAATILGRRGPCGWATARTLLVLGVVGGVDRTEHQLRTLPGSSAWIEEGCRNSHGRTQSSRVKWTGGFARDISSCSTSKSTNHHGLTLIREKGD